MDVLKLILCGIAAIYIEGLNMLSKQIFTDHLTLYRPLEYVA